MELDDAVFGDFHDDSGRGTASDATTAIRQTRSKPNETTANDMTRDAHYPHRNAATPARAPARIALAVFAMTVLLAGCASSGGGREASRPYGLGDEHYRRPTELAAAANDVLMRAIGLVGLPYRYGRNSPQSGFDSSGLIDLVYREAAGLVLPRSTSELIDIDAPKVGRDDLQPGDLVFFNPNGRKVSHIGIYVGEGRFVHAPSHGGMVRLDRLTDAYWAKHYVSAKRVLH
jgi:cell wall-associated NlpC family hydrolase